MFKSGWQAGIVGIAAILILAPGISHAKDYCVNINSGVFILVGQGFTIPSKGKCKPWTGFSAQNNINSPSAGTGCTSSDGSHLNLTITTSFPELAGSTVIDSITLPLPSQNGTDNETRVGGSSTAATFGAVGATCSKNAVPDITTDSNN